MSLKKYYIFAYLQIKIMALFRIILGDMQFSRVRISRRRQRKKKTAEK